MKHVMKRVETNPNARRRVFSVEFQSEFSSHGGLLPVAGNEFGPVITAPPRATQAACATEGQAEFGTRGASGNVFEGGK